MIDFNCNNRARRVELFDGDEGAKAFSEARERGKLLALSLSPVEAWLVVHGLRDCLSRDVYTHFRGELFIHANRTQYPQNFQAVYKFAASIDAALAAKIPSVVELSRNWAGGIVGRAELVGEFSPDGKKFTSFWHEAGRVGWRLANAQAFEVRVPCRGNVGFWEVGIDIAGRLNDAIRALPAPKKSVVKQNLTTQKSRARKSTCNDNLQVATADLNPPKTKRVGKQAMRSAYAKIAKKLKGPTGNKDIK